LGRENHINVQAFLRTPQPPFATSFGPELGRQSHGTCGEGNIAYGHDLIQQGQRVTSPLPGVMPLLTEMEQLSPKLIINDFGNVKLELRLFEEAQDCADNRLVFVDFWPDDAGEDVAVEKKGEGHGSRPEGHALLLDLGF
jgi:hypothetical protein